MSMDQRAQILETVLPAKHGIREVARELRWAPSRVVSLLRKMEGEGLIIWVENYSKDPSMRARASRGRPKKIMTCTPLGIEFLEIYGRLRMKSLRARKEDLERAVRDAHYTERLVAAGHSPFQLFMELNSIVHNIKVSSEAPHST
jgi:predicted ArsR family transcriptional regulator